MGEIVLVAAPTSWARLQQHAELMSRAISPNRGNKPIPFPIEDVIEYELPAYNCELVLVEALPGGVEACVDWNAEKECFNMVLPEDLYQAMYEGDGRARFTAAHEFSHLVIHGEAIRKAAGAVVPSGLFRRSRDVKPFMNAERQANVYAGSLLLPEEVVLSAIATYGLKPDVLAETLQVSLAAMDVRLRELEGRL